MKKIFDYLSHLLIYARAMAKWLVLSVIVGLLCGLLGSAFHYGVSRATLIRETHAWIIYLLPIAGEQRCIQNRVTQIKCI